MDKRLVRDLEIEEALQTEKNYTIAHTNYLFVKWFDISDQKINKKVKLTVTYDMGWHRRSYWRIYDSYSGHSFIICGTSKVIIDVVIYSKAWENCDAADKSR